MMVQSYLLPSSQCISPCDPATETVVSLFPMHLCMRSCHGDHCLPLANVDSPVPLVWLSAEYDIWFVCISQPSSLDFVIKLQTDGKLPPDPGVVNLD